MTIEKILNYFKENQVICKKVKGYGKGCHDFIAIFGYGKLTREEIVECIRKNNLLCMFFEEAIRENNSKMMEGAE